MNHGNDSKQYVCACVSYVVTVWLLLAYYEYRVICIVVSKYKDDRSGLENVSGRIN